VRQLLVLVSVISAGVAVSRGALAQGARRAPEPAAIDARYDEIHAALRRGRPAAKTWWHTWTWSYAALTAGQTVAAVAVNERGLRADFAVGAAQSAIGLVGMLVATPTTPIGAVSSLDAMDASTPKAREARLRRAERLLEKSADEEQQARAWYTQVAGGIVNLSGAFVLWLGYDRFATGWASLAGGVALTELQILTTPTAAIEDWNSYRTRGSIRPREPGRSLSVAPAPGGAVLSGTF
jgi:hypothetical protein